MSTLAHRLIVIHQCTGGGLASDSWAVMDHGYLGHAAPVWVAGAGGS